MDLSGARRALIGATIALIAFFGAATRAQAPEPALTQLVHRAWTPRDSAPSGVLALAQTSDGFLWLGGATGLVRFDGVRFERYEPPPGQGLPSSTINVLTALPNGSLWVGFALGGVSVISDGHLVNYSTRDGLPGGTVSALACDSAGTIWVGTTRGLARLIGTQWHVVGAEAGYTGGFTIDLTVDRRGALWAAAAGGVYVLPRGAQRFTRWAPSLVLREREAGSGGVRAAPDGSVWSVSLSRGVSRLTDSLGRPVPANLFYDRDRGERRGRGWVGMFIDREGNGWSIGTTDRLVRVVLGDDRTKPLGAATWDTLPFSPGSGTSGRTVLAVQDDREGNLWVATENGLDQLRVPKVTAIAWPEVSFVPAIAAAHSGALWAGDPTSSLELVSDRGEMRATVPRGITVAYRDLMNEVWVGGSLGLWHARDGGSFEPVPLPIELRNATMKTVARDRSGTLWVGLRHGVFYRRGNVWARYDTSAVGVFAIATDSAGRTWLGYADGHLVREGEGAARVYGAEEGLLVGSIQTVTVQGRRVWIGGELGVAVLDDSLDNARGARQPRFSSLITTDGPLRSVSGIVPTRDAIWLHDADGVARIPWTEVSRALQETGYRVHAERLDARDGVDRSALYGTTPTAVQGSDERLWFSWLGGLGWIDPAHVRRNHVPPPVMVRGLSADGRSYPAVAAVTLPKRTSALSISYTALSLTMPERVRFRYRLIGLDTAWQDAGARREAFYTNLEPRSYRFEVIAANEDGVRSIQPASLTIVIPPAFVQTNAFFALCMAVAGGVFWVLITWRQHRAVGAARARYEVAFAERMRVARELHDTLLTDIAGLRMQLDAAVRAAGPAGVASSVVATLRDQASETLVNARRAVVEMRASGDGASPLADQIAESVGRIFADTSVSAHVAQTGTPRRFPLVVESEVLRIAGEALANAHAHAGCRSVLVACVYEANAFRLEIRDDGRGFDPARAAANGHYGIVGMYERASVIGARLTIESAPERGTVVHLVVPSNDGS